MSFYQLLMRIRDEYGNPPMLITENGAGFGDFDEVLDGGTVKDPLRTDYIRRHIDGGAPGARRDGADVRGYMLWSLFDNFEWLQGYERRFGMVHVDFDTQKRTPKQSFYAYREIIAGQRPAERRRRSAAWRFLAAVAAPGAEPAAVRRRVRRMAIAAKAAISPAATLVTHTPEHARRPDALIDGEALRADVIALAGSGGELSPPARAAIVARLKQALAEGRAEAERRLKADGQRHALRPPPVRSPGHDHPRHPRPRRRPRLSASATRPPPSAWRSSPSAATAAARWRRAPTSISSSCFPTSRRRGARASSSSSSTSSGISA